MTMSDDVGELATEALDEAIDLASDAASAAAELVADSVVSAADAAEELVSGGGHKLVKLLVMVGLITAAVYIWNRRSSGTSPMCSPASSPDGGSAGNDETDNDAT